MKRALPALVLAVLVLRLVWMHLIPGWTAIQTDFPNYYTAAWMVANDRPLADLYDTAAFARESEVAGFSDVPALFNYFTPFSALTMLPLASLDPLGAKRVWIVLSLGALILSIALVSRLSGVGWVWAGLVAFAAGDALGNNLAFGQFYLVLTALLMAAVLAAERRPAIAGVALSLGALTKVFPVFLLGWLIWTDRRRAALWTIAAITAGSLVGLIILGWLPHRIYLVEVLGRTLRGEIQDPYNVGWNTLQALLRRALVADPALNPEPITNLPGLYFFVRPLLPGFVAVAMFASIRRRPNGNRLLEYGAIMTMISLTTPSQASYHHVLLFPAIAAAVAQFSTLKVRLSLVALYTVYCSDYMGAGTGFDSRLSMLLAFPRAYLTLALWILFLALMHGPRPIHSLGLLWGGRRRPILAAFGMVIVLASISAAGEWRRWQLDEVDGATLEPMQGARMLEIDPAIGDAGVIFASLGSAGFDWLHPSAFGSGVVYEADGLVRGRFRDGQIVTVGPGTEPVLGDGRVLAVLSGEETWSVIESTPGEGWSVLFERPRIVHDLSIAPGGEDIVFSELVAGRYRISEWSRPIGAARVLLAGDVDYRYGAYSPDGSALAFATNPMGDWDIAELDLGGGEVRILTSSRANDLMPAYALDGRSLVFASDRRRGYRFTAIFRMNVR